MDTMTVTKYVGAFCGSLLALLLIMTVAHTIYSTESEEVAYSIPVEDAEAGAEAEAASAEDLDVAALMEAADPGAGEAVFRRCQSCHVVEEGVNRVGPSLYGVVGRDIASVEGFSYSDALAGADGSWDYQHLLHFLGDPGEVYPGTSMSFAGLPNPEDRANVVAYIESQTQ
jgi:cytochrome c